MRRVIRLSEGRVRPCCGTVRGSVVSPWDWRLAAECWCVLAYGFYDAVVQGVSLSSVVLCSWFVSHSRFSVFSGLYVACSIVSGGFVRMQVVSVLLHVLFSGLKKKSLFLVPNGFYMQVIALSLFISFDSFHGAKMMLVLVSQLLLNLPLRSWIAQGWKSKNPCLFLH